MTFTLLKGGSVLNPTVAFTALSLIALLTAPIQELIHGVPMFQTALASLDRVQNFLLLQSNVAGTTQAKPDNPIRNGEHDHATELEMVTTSNPHPDETKSVLHITNGEVRLGKEKKLVLQDINVEIYAGSLNVVVGPVGCGKSILLKAMMGDISLYEGQRINGKTIGYAYCAQDPWLPNDTVSNLVLGQSDWDATWYSTVIHACALNTDITTFPLGDDTAVGTKGVFLSGGQRQRIALARAMYSRKKLVIIDDALSGLDANTSQMVFDRTLGSQGLCKNLGSTVVFATHAVRYLREADHIVALGDDGKIREQGSFQDLAARGSYTHKLSLKIGLGKRSEEQHIREPAKPAAVSDRLETAEQDLARRTGDMAVYSYYAKSIGWLYGSIIIFTAIAFGFNTVFPDLWVKWWSEAEINSHNQRPLSFWVGIYIMFGVLTIISVFVHIWVMLVISLPKSSAQLHKQLLTAVMRAPYSFFVNTDSGITLNRFSNDMSIIEQEMAGAVMQTLDGSCICLMSAALIAAGAEYVGTTMPVIIAVLYGIQRFYLRTSRQLRFMDLEAQAPLLTHCSETLSGVTTIRAFGWQKQSHQKCLDLLDNSQRPYYLMLCIQRWLNLVLDLTTLGIAVVMVAMAMTMRDTSSAGSVGVSMLNILSFNSQLAYLITAWTTLETSLGAVARCKNFEKSTLPEDLPPEIHIPPPDWPQAGELTLTNLSASYNPDSDNVLEDMSLYISPGESLGICGRSGSGKSSLLLTLLRLLNNKTGNITLDGIDLASIPR